MRPQRAGTERVQRRLAGFGVLCAISGPKFAADGLAVLPGGGRLRLEAVRAPAASPGAIATTGAWRPEGRRFRGFSEDPQHEHRYETA